MQLITGIKTAKGADLQEVWDYDGEAEVSEVSDPRVCYYTHFDLSREQLGPTRRYNCWGFTFLPRRYWINSSDDVDKILNDNCSPVEPGSLRPGDVIRYRDPYVTTHTGRVWEVDASGKCVKVRSKWGSMGEYIHAPDDVPQIYGTDVKYFRQNAPLRGVADLWIKDSSEDNGEQYPGTPWMRSPDILVDVPPYDGVPDPQPVLDHPNHVWAVVWNRGDKAMDGVFVRYYWADPATGLAPSDWHLITGTAEHPNPVGPISIPANASVQAPYVEWTPVAIPTEQCLLAIVYINDNPRDSHNPDPLVYPFEVPWDNNIGQCDVHIGAHISILSWLPILLLEPREAEGSVLSWLSVLL